MAVGTLVSFSVQSIAMLWLLDRRLGGLGISQSLKPIAKMIAASVLMFVVCFAIQRLPFYPRGEGKILWAAQLTLLMLMGVSVYFIACMLMGIDVTKHLRSKRSGS
jgi:peptidoglycan biosynthesis protein MviN/MurJ (putative lipid II flippase)